MLCDAPVWEEKCSCYPSLFEDYSSNNMTMEFIEEEKSSSHGDVESSLSGGGHHDNESFSSSTQQNRSSVAVPDATKSRRCRIIALLGVLFLLAIVLVIAIAISPAEKNIAANNIVGINNNNEEQQPQKIPTPLQPQQEEPLLAEEYDKYSLSTIVESAAPSQMPSAKPSIEKSSSPTMSPGQATAPPTIATGAPMTMAPTTSSPSTSPVMTDESTTDDMFVFGDFLDDNDEGFFDDFTEFTCSVFSIFC